MEPLFPTKNQTGAIDALIDPFKGTLKGPFFKEPLWAGLLGDRPPVDLLYGWFSKLGSLC